MKWDHSQVHDRDSLRLKGYDYRLPGAYFVTLGSWQRECLFGEVLEGKIRLNSLGDIVHSEWLKLTHHFPHMQLGEFIVMPNHIHGIIIIEYEAYVGATRPTESEIVDSSSSWVNQIINNRGGSPLRVDTRPNGPKPGSLGAIIGQFKSRATKRIWALPKIDRHPIWQRKNYDHIIQDDQEYHRIIQYIEINPSLWEEDQFHSSLPGN